MFIRTRFLTFSPVSLESSRFSGVRFLDGICTHDGFDESVSPTEELDVSESELNDWRLILSWVSLLSGGYSVSSSRIPRKARSFRGSLCSRRYSLCRSGTQVSNSSASISLACPGWQSAQNTSYVSFSGSSPAILVISPLLAHCIASARVRGGCRGYCSSLSWNRLNHWTLIVR